MLLVSFGFCLREVLSPCLFSAGAILVFVDRQDACDALFKDIIKSGYNCTSIHGGKDQEDRDEAIRMFKKGEVNILIATSVAARGLDVPHLRLVVNFDVPNHLEDYVHRVGRTGRAGVAGTAVTFITPDEDQYVLCRLSSILFRLVFEKLTQLLLSQVCSGFD
jgi:ATP-dependent RNA helicase DDX46/PRP5